MREIKFRAWDKVAAGHEGMFDIVGFVLRGSEYRIWYEFEHDGRKQIFNRSYSKRNLVVMQSTTLKDKNGVEIFESDIVESYSFYGHKIKDVVSFREGYWFPLVEVEHNHNCIDKYDSDGFEVIGNIYENPELLGD